MNRYMNALIVMVIVLVGAATAGAEIYYLRYTPIWQDSPINARAMGMGGAYSGVLEGPEAARWNPAVPLEGKAFAASWSRAADPDEGLLVDRWSGAVSGEVNGLRVSLIRDDVSVGPMLVRTPYLPEGTGATFQNWEKTDLLSVSGDITSVFLPERSDLVTFGVGVRKTTFSSEGRDADGEVEDEFDSDMYGLDLGLSVGDRHQYGRGNSIMGWRVSAALINGFRGSVDNILDPNADLRIGGAWSIEQSDRGGIFDSLRLMFAADWTRTVLYGADDLPWEHRLGAELLVHDRLALRLGSVESNESPVLADSMWGLGLVWDDLHERIVLNVDYARLKYDDTVLSSGESQDVIGLTCSVSR